MSKIDISLKDELMTKEEAIERVKDQIKSLNGTLEFLEELSDDDRVYDYGTSGFSVMFYAEMTGAKGITALSNGMSALRYGDKGGKENDN